MLNPFAWFKKIDKDELISRLKSNDLVEDDVSSYIKEKEDLGLKVAKIVGWNVSRDNMVGMPCEPKSCKTTTIRMLREIPTDSTSMINVLDFIRKTRTQWEVRIEIDDGNNYHVTIAVPYRVGSSLKMAYTCIGTHVVHEFMIAFVKAYEYEKQEQNRNNSNLPTSL
jgi:hypothetical protein